MISTIKNIVEEKDISFGVIILLGAKLLIDQLSIERGGTIFKTLEYIYYKVIPCN